MSPLYHIGLSYVEYDPAMDVLRVSLTLDIPVRRLVQQALGMEEDMATLAQALADLKASNDSILAEVANLRAAQSTGDSTALQAAADAIEAEVARQTDTLHPAVVEAAPSA